MVWTGQAKKEEPKQGKERTLDTKRLDGLSGCEGGGDSKYGKNSDKDTMGMGWREMGNFDRGMNARATFVLLYSSLQAAVM